VLFLLLQPIMKASLYENVLFGEQLLDRSDGRTGPWLQRVEPCADYQRQPDHNARKPARSDEVIQYDPGQCCHLKGYLLLIKGKS
jgi:hypothetical protein